MSAVFVHHLIISLWTEVESSANLDLRFKNDLKQVGISEQFYLLAPENQIFAVKHCGDS